jgi:hypothetical protein
MNKSHLLINEPALQVLPSLALAVGLEEAIILQQLHYWLNNPKSEGRIDANGNKWVYNTYAEWQEDNFPFWSEDKIKRIFLKLEEQKVVISRQLDAKMRDMTKFYRIDYDVLCTMDGAILPPSNTSNLHDVKMNQRLPETTTPELSEQDLEQVNSKVDYMIGIAQQADALLTACQTFEMALFGSPVNWPWSSNAKWQKFAKWCAEQDPSKFTEYAAWRKGDGKFHAMSNNKIRQDPQMFMDTGWPTFLAQSSMYGSGNRDKGFAL